MPITTLPTGRFSRLRRILVRLGVVLVALAAVAYIGLATTAAVLLTTPRRSFGPETPASVNLEYQDVQFPARSDAVAISGWYIPAAGAHRAVVLVHGIDCNRTCWFTSDMAGMPRALHAQGYAVLAIDLRGHGRSGAAHYSFGLAERNDVLGAVDWLAQHHIAPGSIGVLGLSLGAASSIGALADDPQIGALVADSSYAAIKPLLQREWGPTSHLPQWMLPPSLLMARLLFGYDIASARPVDEIGRIAPRPVLLIHGDADTFVPAENTRQLQAAYPAAQVWNVPGATHARAHAAAPQEYEARVTAFFARSLP